MHLSPHIAPYLADPIVVGLSGGRDSVALLRLLHSSGADLRACHVHHGIRGADADADADFCARLCADLGIPFELYRVDVPALARATGESLETAARHARRRILADHARRHACPAVALAHHADDQAETILFHLARGSAGPCGMQPVTEYDGVRWLRPLLHCRRAEITDWLRQLDQPWRDDATNTVPDITRNRLRLQVLPALNSAMGRDVAPILCRSARLHAEQSDALRTALHSLPLCDPQGRLFLPFLADKPRPFCKAVVHHYLRQCGVPDITEKTVLDVLDIISSTSAPSVCNLPGGFRAHRKEKRLNIRNDQ